MEKLAATIILYKFIKHKTTQKTLCEIGVILIETSPN